jgi:hypothetical protein
MKSFLIQLVKDEHLSIPNTNTGSNEIRFREEQNVYSKHIHVIVMKYCSDNAKQQPINQYYKFH